MVSSRTKVTKWLNTTCHVLHVKEKTLLHVAVIYIDHHKSFLRVFLAYFQLLLVNLLEKICFFKKVYSKKILAKCIFIISIKKRIFFRWSLNYDGTNNKTSFWCNKTEVRQKNYHLISLKHKPGFLVLQTLFEKSWYTWY